MKVSQKRKLTLYTKGKKVREMEIKDRNMERFWQRWRERLIEKYGLDSDDLEAGKKG